MEFNCLLMRYCICNIHIAAINFGNNEEWKKFTEKSINEQKQMDIEIVLGDGNYINNILCKFISDNSIILEREGTILLIDKEWKKVEIYSSSDIKNIFVLIMRVFYAHALQRHMIQLHSSLIASPGNHGIMFLGPSGIGKTTQAELWNKYRDALIINGDIVFVQETPEGFLGWGTPWHGSSPYCENTSVPLKAMVVLKQAPENSIRELTGFEKVSEVSNSVFYPQWLENGMELCLETLDHLLTNIPVYQLSCRPDEDAVRLTEQAIFGTSGL